MKSSPGFGYGEKVILTVVVAAIAVMAFSVTFYFHNSSAVVIPQTKTSSYQVDNSTGLELIAQTNSNELASGNSISISIKVLNTKGYVNALKTSRDFPQLPGNYRFSVNPCNYNPFGIAVAKGNYSTSNLEYALPLTIFEPAIINCPAIFAATQYQFLAHSTKAKMYNPNDNPSIIGTTSFSASLNLSGYWSGTVGNHTFHLFSSGIYTIIAADGWGQVTVLHFTVT